MRSRIFPPDNKQRNKVSKDADIFLALNRAKNAIPTFELINDSMPVLEKAYKVHANLS